MSDNSDNDLVERYLARVGYHGHRKPTQETLRELHRLHPSTIAYENIDPLMGRPVDLAEESLAAKMIDGGRGVSTEEGGIDYGPDCSMARRPIPAKAA